MKCLLIYGTLSGSTMTAAELIGNTLRAAGHDVDVLSVESVTKDSVKNYDAVIIGSPSWEDQGKDGQPLPEITAFVSTLTTQDLADKKTAVFGLGDISYPHFCGAVDVIEDKFSELSITPIVESLCVDRFYSLADNEQKVKSWAENLAKVMAR
ncbi:MAG: flavodoxin domain-containing protein [Patescibacteria group bacterium]